MPQDGLWTSLGKVAPYTGRMKESWSTGFIHAESKITGSCLLCSFLRSAHTFQKDTATGLTENLAPSWGAASHVTLQCLIELHSTETAVTAGDLLALLKNENFSRKVVRCKLIKLGFVTNGQAHK